MTDAGRAQTYKYTVMGLGTLGGATSEAYGINAYGHVVGRAKTATGEDHAFLWQMGSMVDLGTLVDNDHSRAFDVNDWVEVAGNSHDITMLGHGFLWRNGTMTDLGTLDPDPESAANAINNFSEVVGFSYQGIGSDGRAFLWRNGKMSELGTLGGSSSFAYDINDYVQVVGAALTGSGGSHAFLWEGGSMSDLGTLSGYAFSLASGINNSGQVVGYAEDLSLPYRALLWHSGSMTNLGTLPGYTDSIARCISDTGQVVGYAFNTDPLGARHAFLWESGVMKDLNDLICPGTGWVLLQAEDVNAAGQIVGVGEYLGQEQAFLLAPAAVDPCPIVVTEVSSEFVDPSKTRVYFVDGVSLSQTFTATVDWSGHTPGVVRFVTPLGDYEDSSGGDTAEQTFDMGSDFGEDGILTVIAQSDDDPPVESNHYVAQLKVVPRPQGLGLAPLSPLPTAPLKYTSPKVKDGEMTWGDSLGPGTIPSQIPLFGGTAFGFQEYINASVEVAGSGSAFAGFELSTDVGEGKTWKMAGFQFSVKASGRATWDYKEDAPGGADWVPGGQLGLAGALGFPVPPKPAYFPVGPCPVCVPGYWRGNVDIEAAGDVAVSAWAAPGSPTWSSVFTPSIKARASLGIGVADMVSGEGYLGGGAIAEITYPEIPHPNPGTPGETTHWKSIKIFFNGGVQLVLLFVSYDWPLVECSYDFVAGTGDCNWFGGSKKGIEGGPRVRIIPRDYLASRGVYAAFVANDSPKNSSRQSRGTVETPVQTNVFGQSTPDLAASDDDLLLVWIYDDPIRTPTNRTEVIFTKFDSSSQTWGTPEAVADDGTADFHPQIAPLPGGDALMAWENVSEVLVEPADPDDPVQVEAKLEELKSKMEIGVARYDSTAGMWETQTIVTTNGFMDRTPRLATATDGTAMLTWVSNAANHPIGTNGAPNILHYSVYDGAVWSAPADVATNVTSVVTSAMAYNGTEAILLFVGDTDGDTQTAEDRELYAITYDGIGWSSLTQLTSDAVEDASPHPAYDTYGNLVIVWYSGGNIEAATDAALSDRHAIVLGPADGPGGMVDFQLATSSTGRIGLVWSDTGTDDGRDLWTSGYDATLGVWSKPQQLTADEEAERDVAPVFTASGDLVTAYNKVQFTYETRTMTVGDQLIEITDIPVPDQVDLNVLRHVIGGDLSVSDGDVRITPGDPVAGETVAITATIRNVGDLGHADIEVGCYDGDPGAGGTLIDTATYGGPLVGGDSADVSVNWLVPASVAPRDLYVIVDPSLLQSDGDRSNNTASFTTLRPDVAVEQIVVEKPEPNDRLLTTRVTNLSGSEASGFDVVLHRDDVDGTVLATLPIAGPIAAGSYEDVQWLWDEAVPFAGGSAAVFAVADEADVVAEFDEDNNIRTVLLTDEDPVVDCNLNGYSDALDISGGASQDCNSNGVPDECDVADADCNFNEIPDDCDIASGTSTDVDSNGIPDDCIGACCDPYEASCTEVTATDCLQSGGVYLGYGSSCVSAPCALGGYRNEISPITNAYAPGAGVAMGDDIVLAGTGARQLTYYDLAVYGGGGGAFDVTAELWTDCPGSGGTLIAGTSENWTGVPDDGYVHILSAHPDSVTIPDSVWMIVAFSTEEASWVIAGSAETGFTDDLFGVNDGSWVCNYYWGGDPYSGLWANLRCAAEDCNTNGVPDPLEIATGAAQDCNLNDRPDECDIADTSSADANTNGVPDECEDCNNNSIVDEFDISAGTSKDCNNNELPDECDISGGTSQDCNANTVPDECDIAGGTSTDCSSNGIPDECEPDCNSNGIADECDIVAGTSQDCNSNIVPDECEPDCNGNSIADDCDITAGTSTDADADGIPDECEDCNNNGIGDPADISAGTSFDCQSNGIPDECDVAGLIVPWGSNFNGQSDAPDGNFLAIGAGYSWSLAVKIDGSLAAWGNNYYGQCNVPAGNDYVAVAGGLGHGLALKRDGSVVAWGLNGNGQCDVPPGNDYAAIDAGDIYSLALKTDGSLAAWGHSYYGQCDVPPGNDYIAIAAGEDHGLALKADGSIVGWGNPENPYGQEVPPAGNDYVAIATAWFHSLAIKQDGSMVGWGLDSYGQASPPAGNDYIAVACGRLHSVALKADGSVIAWGYTNYFSIPTPTSSDFTVITSGAEHCFGLDPWTSSDMNHNLVPDECEDCNGNSILDSIDITAGTSEDCNRNTLPDECDIAGGTSEDCNTDGMPDECEPDCNSNGVADECDVTSGASRDCNTNGVPDECEPDCNENSVADECDIAFGTSPDCNTNGTPDECEPDCNKNDVADECDIAAGTSPDCNANGTPDECEPDCNDNDVADECDISGGTSADTDANGVPDECQDCNGNGVLDDDEIAGILYVLMNMADETVQMYAVNPASPGSSTYVGELDQRVDVAYGLAAHPQTDALYAVVWQGNKEWLATVDPQTAEVTMVDRLYEPINDIAFRDDGMLYGVVDGYADPPASIPGALVTISTLDATLTETGTILGVGSGTLYSSVDFLPMTGFLYHTWVYSGYRKMTRINVDTGEVVVLHSEPTGAMPRSLAFHPSGTSFLAGETSRQLYSVDWVSGEKTYIGTVGPVPSGTGTDLHGIAFLADGVDCNGNGLLDSCDISSGTSLDTNGNTVPDECEDCNGNTVDDFIDLSAGISLDCNFNAVPDECDISGGTSQDCNGNGVPDACDLAVGTSADCNSSGIPDECENDCNTNGVADECDINTGTSQDCNINSVPDECDIAAASSQDCNTNAIPDDCEADSDDDGVIDDCDRCPNDPNKTDPGLCGCGAPDIIPEGDLDQDCDVDLDDYILFESCLTGPGSGAPPPCASSDMDIDGDVDLGDFANFQGAFNGP